MNEVVLTTNLRGLKLVRRGKVRDVYEVGDRLLIVATDRVSAFDVVLPDGIPGKGRALTQISLFWFTQLADIAPTHLLSASVDEFPPECRPHAQILEGRSMLVRRAQPFPVECIVRGYLAGSGWSEYQKRGTVCEIPLPAGLSESEELPQPLFTPSTKAPEGEHDENISYEECERLVGDIWASRLRDTSLQLYRRATELARGRGLLLADTKLEFGLHDNELMVIDEVFTPDSSRYWLTERYQRGRSQDSFDKQVIRDHLIAAGWNRRPPAPSLPQNVIDMTSVRYAVLGEVLTGAAPVDALATTLSGMR